MKYKYCSICGGDLKEVRGGNLECIRCAFVNYQNPRPTVTGLIMYKDKLLLTKRARKPFLDWWDLPGGFMNRGETPEAALIRELREETGLRIKLVELFGVYPGTYPSSFDPFHIVSLVYLACPNTGSLKAFDDVSESKWFSRGEVPKKIAFDSNKKIIKDYLRIWN